MKNLHFTIFGARGEGGEGDRDGDGDGDGEGSRKPNTHIKEESQGFPTPAEIKRWHRNQWHVSYGYSSHFYCGFTSGEWARMKMELPSASATASEVGTIVVAGVASTLK